MLDLTLYDKFLSKNNRTSPLFEVYFLLRETFLSA